MSAAGQFGLVIVAAFAVAFIVDAAPKIGALLLVIIVLGMLMYSKAWRPTSGSSNVLANAPTVPGLPYGTSLPLPSGA